MTGLTQDWKDGKLKEGSYYIKLNTGEVVIDYYRWNEDFDEYSRYIFDYHNDDDVEQFTGLYDRFHNPIYQGDWLRTPDNTYCYVVRDRGFWAVKSLPSEAIDFEHSDFYEKCKVVATYNEHPNYMEEVSND